MRVLIADDQAKVRYALIALLRKKLGLVEVVEVDQPDCFASEMRCFSPHLLFIDWNFLRKTGVSILQIRHDCPESKIIILSEKQIREQTIAAGADVFICKLFAPDELLDVLSVLAKQ